MLLRSPPRIPAPEPSLLRAQVIVKQACSSAKAIFVRAARLRLKSHCVPRRFAAWNRLASSGPFCSQRFLEEPSSSQVKAHEQKFVCREPRLRHDER